MTNMASKKTLHSAQNFFLKSQTNSAFLLFFIIPINKQLHITHQLLLKLKPSCIAGFNLINTMDFKGNWCSLLWTHSLYFIDKVTVNTYLRHRETRART